MSTIKVNNIQSRTGSAISFTSGDTITIPSGATLDGSSATLTGFATTNGITMVDNWRQTVNFYVSSGFNSLTTNWERADTNSSGFIGTGMTESSGVFTFPQTGIYEILGSWYVYEGGGATAYISFAIELSTDGGSSFGNAVQSYTHVENVSSQHSTIAGNYILDVTDTATHKIRFAYESQSASVVRLVGNSNLDTSYVRFIRLGDT